MSRPTRTAARAAFIGGVAWAVDVAVIFAVDGSSDPLDSILFFAGLVANLTAVVVLAAGASHDRSGVRRVLAGGGALLAIAAALAVVSIAGDELVRALYSGSNAVRDEGSVLAVALVALASGAALRRTAPR